MPVGLLNLWHILTYYDERDPIKCQIELRTCLPGRLRGFKKDTRKTYRPRFQCPSAPEKQRRYP